MRGGEAAEEEQKDRGAREERGRRTGTAVPKSHIHTHHSSQYRKNTRVAKEPLE